MIAFSESIGIDPRSQIQWTVKKNERKKKEIEWIDCFQIDRSCSCGLAVNFRIRDSEEKCDSINVFRNYQSTDRKVPAPAVAY